MGAQVKLNIVCFAPVYAREFLIYDIANCSTTLHMRHTCTTISKARFVTRIRSVKQNFKNKSETYLFIYFSKTSLLDY